MDLPVKFMFPSEDVKRLSDRLVEVNATNMQLRLKLDELEALEVSIKVSMLCWILFLFHSHPVYKL